MGCHRERHRRLAVLPVWDGRGTRFIRALGASCPLISIFCYFDIKPAFAAAAVATDAELLEQAEDGSKGVHIAIGMGQEVKPGFVRPLFLAFHFGMEGRVHVALFGMEELPPVIGGKRTARQPVDGVMGHRAVLQLWRLWQTWFPPGKPISSALRSSSSMKGSGFSSFRRRASSLPFSNPFAPLSSMYFFNPSVDFS